ncbi:MAG TPA: hypothetical protein VGP16_32865 [Asanoa sp.]|nr:hypothetical protein [Asanoa sp.]
MFETAAGYGQGEWNQGEDEWGRRRRWRRRRRLNTTNFDEDDEFGAELGYEDEDEGEGEDEDAGEEERFLPLIAAGLKLLPTILGAIGGGGARKELDEGEDGEDGEEGEAEERFLGQLVKKFLGAEIAGEDELPLSPHQEAKLAERLLEASGEDELRQVLGQIVNAVGAETQGVPRAAETPQGRALVAALTPVTRTVVPGTGLSPGEVFESEASGMSQEQEVYESARQAVRLAAAAARNVAAAPPGAPPEVVGELGILRAASRFARPLFGRALRAFSPLARRAFGFRGGYRGRSGYRGGYRGPRYGGGYRYGGYRGPRYGYRGYGGPRYGYGYGYPVGAAPIEGPPDPFPPPPVTAPAPPPEPPGPPQAGFRWVAVPIGAPPPPSAPPEPAPPGAGAPPDAAPPTGQGPPPPGQSEWNEWNPGEWGPNTAEWGETEWGQGEDEYQPGEFAPAGYGEAPGPNGHDDGQSGRWVRRRGKIVLLGA